MSARALRIVPVYGQSKYKRAAHDVVAEMEAIGVEAWQQGKVIEAFEVCPEDYALLTALWGDDKMASGSYEIGLIGHEKNAIIREAK